MLFYNWYLLGVKKFRATPTKQAFGTSLGLFSKLPTSIPVLFIWNINRVTILAILVINRVWPFPSSLEMGMFLKRSYFFITIEKTIRKSPSQIMIDIGLGN